MNQHTRNIIVDSLILVAFSSILGGISLVVSKSFSGDPNPALDLITVMKKAEAKEVNASSEQEEQEAMISPCLLMANGCATSRGRPPGPQK